MLDLFTPIAEDEKQHPLFKMMLKDQYKPERDVLNSWAQGFEDRDGKFIYEFQTTFESSMWELYLHAFLKDLGAQTDFSHHAPDFVTELDRHITLEATIAAPPQGGEAPAGHSQMYAPTDFSEFNQQSAIRISNSLSSKIKKFRTSYSDLPHVKDKPYVIGLASFDRPFSHFAVNRAIVAVLYGVYVDEETTIATGASELIKYSVKAVVKNENASIPLGLFTSDEYKDVSAVIYSSLATWGKIRALADNPNAMSVYHTCHLPKDNSIIPEVRHTIKAEYKEDIADGLHILHNPFAQYPLDVNTFNHARVAQYFFDPEKGINVIAPDDFLLLRQIKSIVTR
ncbi:TPA: glycosaminoglycan attachment site [Vibrio cholerae]|uniref:glycosaminoglycan attachment site n=1 Tax=Vibrio cholerae TaxID=666 RepID=UPI0028DA7927|nr:glycosaminoglycan attachment site [Vibrio cholerae]ELJ8556245.1 glycosaminoglycan attachment site [Vibrio cholerae]HDI3277692.1 glycosaminoglycan attachment site [Vibrio cholerae]HDL9469881.1 glycosaminoglycan attachment site [Vibrio cholerae]